MAQGSPVGRHQPGLGLWHPPAQPQSSQGIQAGVNCVALFLCCVEAGSEHRPTIIVSICPPKVGMWKMTPAQIFGMARNLFESRDEVRQPLQFTSCELPLPRQTEIRSWMDRNQV